MTTDSTKEVAPMRYGSRVHTAMMYLKSTRRPTSLDEIVNVNPKKFSRKRWDLCDDLRRMSKLGYVIETDGETFQITAAGAEALKVLIARRSGMRVPYPR